jgi:hypothetical protein
MNEGVAKKTRNSRRQRDNRAKTTTKISLALKDLILPTMEVSYSRNDKTQDF